MSESEPLARIAALLELEALHRGRHAGALSRRKADERMAELRKEIWKGDSALVAEHERNPMNHIGRVREQNRVVECRGRWPRGGMADLAAILSHAYAGLDYDAAMAKIVLGQVYINHKVVHATSVGIAAIHAADVLVVGMLPVTIKLVDVG